MIFSKKNCYMWTIIFIVIFLVPIALNQPMNVAHNVKNKSLASNQIKDSSKPMTKQQTTYTPDKLYSVNVDDLASVYGNPRVVRDGSTIFVAFLVYYPLCSCTFNSQTISVYNSTDDGRTWHLDKQHTVSSSSQILSFDMVDDYLTHSVFIVYDAEEVKTAGRYDIHVWNVAKNKDIPIDTTTNDTRNPSISFGSEFNFFTKTTSSYMIIAFQTINTVTDTAITLYESTDNGASFNLWKYVGYDSNYYINPDVAVGCQFLGSCTAFVSFSMGTSYTAIQDLKVAMDPVTSTTKHFSTIKTLWANTAFDIGASSIATQANGANIFSLSVAFQVRKSSSSSSTYNYIYDEHSKDSGSTWYSLALTDVSVSNPTTTFQVPEVYSADNRYYIAYQVDTATSNHYYKVAKSDINSTYWDLSWYSSNGVYSVDAYPFTAKTLAISSRYDSRHVAVPDIVFSYDTLYYNAYIQKLASPNLTLPTNLAQESTKLINFTWSTVKNAQDYQIEIHNSSSSFTSPLVDYNTSSTKYSATLSNGTYYWRIRGIDALNAGGNWSVTDSFKVSIITPSSTSTTTTTTTTSSSTTTTTTSSSSTSSSTSSSSSPPIYSYSDTGSAANTATSSSSKKTDSFELLSVFFALACIPIIRRYKKKF